MADRPYSDDDLSTVTGAILKASGDHEDSGTFARYALDALAAAGRLAGRAVPDVQTLAAIVCDTRDDTVHQLLDENYVCVDCWKIARELHRRLTALPEVAK